MVFLFLTSFIYLPFWSHLPVHCPTQLYSFQCLFIVPPNCTAFTSMSSLIPYYFFFFLNLKFVLLFYLHISFRVCLSQPNSLLILLFFFMKFSMSYFGTCIFCLLYFCNYSCTISMSISSSLMDRTTSCDLPEHLI